MGVDAESAEPAVEIARGNPEFLYPPEEGAAGADQPKGESELFQPVWWCATAPIQLSNNY